MQGEVYGKHGARIALMHQTNYSVVVRWVSFKSFPARRVEACMDVRYNKERMEDAQVVVLNEYKRVKAFYELDEARNYD